MLEIQGDESKKESRRYLKIIRDHEGNENTNIHSSNEFIAGSWVEHNSNRHGTVI